MVSLTSNDGLLILVLLIFILGDKITTYLCVQGMQNNYPDTQSSSIEKNAMAKWFMDKLGNFWGNMVMVVISLIIALIILTITKLISIKFGHPEYFNYVLYGLIILYTFVIGNNTYYALKYNKII